VMAEMLNMAMFHVVGCDATVALATQAGQLELNVMSPVIAYNLFEMMQIMIAAVQAFTERAVRGVTANRAKTESWLAQNPMIVTALNPLIGYYHGAELAREATMRHLTIREVAVEKASVGGLMHVDENRIVTIEEIETALSNLQKPS